MILRKLINKLIQHKREITGDKFKNTQKTEKFFTDTKRIHTGSAIFFKAQSIPRICYLKAQQPHIANTSGDLGSTQIAIPSCDTSIARDPLACTLCTKPASFARQRQIARHSGDKGVPNRQPPWQIPCRLLSPCMLAICMHGWLVSRAKQRPMMENLQKQPILGNSF